MIKTHIHFVCYCFKYDIILFKRMFEPSHLYILSLLFCIHKAAHKCAPYIMALEFWIVIYVSVCEQST